MSRRNWRGSIPGPSPSPKSARRRERCPINPLRQPFAGFRQSEAPLLWRTAHRPPRFCHPSPPLGPPVGAPPPGCLEQPHDSRIADSPTLWCSPQRRSSAAPLRSQPVTAPGFGIFSNSLAMSRQGGLRTRPSPDPTIRHSQFAIRNLFSFTIRYSLFAIRCSSARHSPLAQGGGCPQTEARRHIRGL
jgi:hypothetical protein